jgi:hypothetical protein
MSVINPPPTSAGGVSDGDKGDVVVTAAGATWTVDPITGSGSFVRASAPVLSAPTGLVKGDVGLANVDNTADSAKPVSSAQQTALDLKANLTTALDAIGACTDITTRNASTSAHGLMMKYPGGSTDFLRADGTFAAPTAAAAWGSITGTLSGQTDLQTALDGKQPLDADLTTIAGLTATTDNFLVSVSSAWASRTVAQVKTTLALGSVDNTADTAKPVSTAQQTALDLKATIANPSFTGTTLTLANAQDIVINATTGTKIGQSGSKIGFFGLTPVVRPTAITQTYATASATHANVTQLAAPAGGTGVAAGGWSTAANRDLAIVSINAARTDIANVKQVLNQVIDQLQALGLLQ